MKAFGRNRWHAWLVVFGLALTSRSLAAYSTIHLSSELAHPAILDGIYGGTFVGVGAALPNGFNTVYFNGTTTATRVDDDGFVTLLNMLTGGPGTGDDDVWTDGVASASAEARFAGFAQEFGYRVTAGSFVKLFEVSGSGFAVTGAGMVEFGMGATWEWARANDSDSSLLNPHYSDEASNSDGLDHMVTYQITGAPSIDPSSIVWLVFFEDLNGPLGSTSDPLNAGNAADRDFNDLAVQLIVTQCNGPEDCDDGIDCTIDSCGMNGFCVHTPDDGQCDDFVACTVDTCDPMLGCVFDPDDDSCDDKNACTDDFCDPVLDCTAFGVECEDNDPCTENECDPDSGCFFPQINCDDQIECTIDTCDSQMGGCLNTPDHASCDDSNECTVDICDPMQGGCVYTNEPDGTACGNQVPEGPCDRPDVCVAGMCEPNYEPMTTECRMSNGVCDVPEFCTGTGPDCPPDGFASAGLECRMSNGECDPAEFCTGSAADCPMDVSDPDGTPCAPDMNDCSDDVCQGGACTHPPSMVGTPCGDGSDTDCDNPDSCDGTGLCLPNYEPTTTECRASAGFCDVAEFCDGAGSCPPDGFQPDTLECRASAGVCDVAELCTGNSADCPPDGFAPDTTVCRPAVDECDVDEQCPGDGPDCPADGFASAGTSCPDDGDECTSDECDGLGACQHPDNQLCGSCCLADKSCITGVLDATCTGLGGSFNGAQSICLGDSDNDGIDDHCDNCPGVDDATFGERICQDSNGDGSELCESDTDCPPGFTCKPACQMQIPTVSEWGILVLALSLLVTAKLYFGDRRPVAACR